jgi:zinc-ribbon domain
VSLQFCPYCGKPRAAADATFCGYCGRSFADAAATVANPAPPSGMPASPLPAENSYGVYAGATGTPYRAPLSGQKSAGLALVLEWLVPGVGAMYAGDVGTGISWLFGTYAWGVISTLLLLGALQGANQPEFIQASGVAFLPVVLVSLVIAALGIGWFVTRLLVVNGKIQAFNQRLAAGIASAPGSAATFDGGRAASSVALALAVSIVVPLLLQGGRLDLFFDSLAPLIFFEFLVGVASLVPFAFAIAIFRLPQVPWWRALLEVMAGLAIMQFALLLGSVVLRILRSPDFSVSTILLSRFPIQYIVFEILLPVLLAAGLGLPIGLLFARWQNVRVRGSGNSFLLAGAAVVTGIVVYLALDAGALNALLGLFSNLFPDAEAFLVTVDTADAAATIAIKAAVVLAAALIMRSCLKRGEVPVAS